MPPQWETFCSGSQNLMRCSLKSEEMLWDDICWFVSNYTIGLTAWYNSITGYINYKQCVKYSADLWKIPGATFFYRYKKNWKEWSENPGYEVRWQSSEKLGCNWLNKQKTANCKCLIWLTAKSDTSRFKRKCYSYCTYWPLRDYSRSVQMESWITASFTSSSLYVITIFLVLHVK